MTRTTFYRYADRNFRLAALLSMLALFSSLGCAKAPPTLSPEAQQAFYKTRVIKALDLARDFAIDGEATTPQVLSTETTRKIVLWHQASLKVIQASDAGWAAAITQSLTELRNGLADAEKQKFGPYLALIQVTLQEVLR